MLNFECRETASKGPKLLSLNNYQSFANLNLLVYDCLKLLKIPNVPNNDHIALINWDYEGLVRKASAAYQGLVMTFEFSKKRITVNVWWLPHFEIQIIGTCNQITWELFHVGHFLDCCIMCSLYYSYGKPVYYVEQNHRSIHTASHDASWLVDFYKVSNLIVMKNISFSYLSRSFFRQNILNVPLVKFEIRACCNPNIVSFKVPNLCHQHTLSWYRSPIPNLFIYFDVKVHI